MRRLKHIIYTILILALIGYIVWVQYPKFNAWLMVSQKDSINPTGTTVQLAYQLRQNKWTTFPISRGTAHLKFLTNAEYYKTHNNTINYAITIKILNSANKVLMNRIFHFKNNTELYKKKHSSRILSNPFLIKGKCYITPNLTYILPLNELEKPAQVKLKWHTTQASKDVRNVLVRMSSQAQFSGLKKKVLWYRLSPDVKKSLSSGNFYPHQMLTTAEKQNILTHLWSPIGPHGNSGQDYFVRRIGNMPTNELVSLNLLIKDDPKTEEKEGFKTEMFKLYVSSGTNGFFRPQTTKNINAAKSLFIKLFNGSTALELKEDWKKLGMNIAEFKRGKRVFTTVYEEEDKLWGRGFYVFCKSSIARDIALEIPHRYWDEKTGIIGYKLMLTGYYSAAAWNTVHRYQTANDLISSSDMAHAENSFFYSFTKAFAENMPEHSMLIQPHGFSNKKQKSEYGKKASVVLSNSTTNPSKLFLYYAKLLEGVMPQPVYIYPLTDIKWLAALDNVSAAVLRKEKKKQVFIHIEMNDETRKDMTNEFKLRKKITNCLIKETTKLYPNDKTKKDMTSEFKLRKKITNSSIKKTTKLYPTVNK